MTQNFFWRDKPLSAMSQSEWESLCDGCARCCLIKLEDEESLEVFYTNVSCELLDIERCTCTDYVNRERRVPTCLKLTPERVGELSWMPDTCAYRLLSEGRELYWWHPLVSGDPESVHRAGISVRNMAVSEQGVAVEDLEDYIISLPEEA